MPRPRPATPLGAITPASTAAGSLVSPGATSLVAADAPAAAPPGAIAPASTAAASLVSPGATSLVAVDPPADDTGLAADSLAAVHPAVRQVALIAAGDLAVFQDIRAETAAGNPWACDVPRAPARSRASSRTLSHGPPPEPLSAHDKDPMPSLRSEGPGQFGQQARERSRSPAGRRRGESSSSSSEWWSSSDEDEYGTDIFLGWTAADWIDTAWRVVDVERGPQRTFVLLG